MTAVVTTLKPSPESLIAAAEAMQPQLRARVAKADREAAIARYLDAGSAGLKEFDRLRIEGPAKLAATVASHPRYYESLRGREARIAEFEPAIRDSLHAMQRLYPAAIFPDVYIVIGRMNSGGTLSPTGLLVGLEMYGRHEGWPEDELGD